MISGTVTTKNMKNGTVTTTYPDKSTKIITIDGEGTITTTYSDGTWTKQFGLDSEITEIIFDHNGITTTQYRAGYETKTYPDDWDENQSGGTSSQSENTSTSSSSNEINYDFTAIFEPHTSGLDIVYGTAPPGAEVEVHISNIFDPNFYIFVKDYADSNGNYEVSLGTVLEDGRYSLNLVDGFGNPVFVKEIVVDFNEMDDDCDVGYQWDGEKCVPIYYDDEGYQTGTASDSSGTSTTASDSEYSGTSTTNSDGTVTTVYPDGTSVWFVHDGDMAIITYPDGTTEKTTVGFTPSIQWYVQLGTSIWNFDTSEEAYAAIAGIVEEYLLDKTTSP